MVGTCTVVKICRISLLYHIVCSYKVGGCICNVKYANDALVSLFVLHLIVSRRVLYSTYCDDEECFL
jgi:hypothetical protein